MTYFEQLEKHLLMKFSFLRTSSKSLP